MVEDVIDKYIMGDSNALRNINAPITTYFVSEAGSASKSSKTSPKQGSSGVVPEKDEKCSSKTPRAARQGPSGAVPVKHGKISNTSKAPSKQKQGSSDGVAEKNKRKDYKKTENGLWGEVKENDENCTRCVTSHSLL